MSWFLSFVVAFLSAVVAAVAAGFVAAGCVAWYHVSSREGGDAYFVIYIGFLGGFIGFWTGLIISRFASGFWTGLGISTGSLLAVAGLIALIAWVLADIPPEIDGHEIGMTVEVRMPAGAVKPVFVEGKQFLVFNAGDRLRELGSLHVQEAAQIDGRWIVPGFVRIPTTRDPRSLTIVIDPDHGIGFELKQLPKHPGPQYRQWSAWIPDAVADHWPDSKISYRFKIDDVVPEQPVVPQNSFDALTEDSPLEEWLRHFDGFARIPAQHAAIMAEVARRPQDLAKLLRSPDDEIYGKAMDVTAQLPTIDPPVMTAMRDEGSDFIDRIRAGEDPARTYRRFNRWCAPWEHVCSLTGQDGAPLVAEIRRMALEKKDNAIAEQAQTLLGYFAAAKK